MAIVMLYIFKVYIYIVSVLFCIFALFNKSNKCCYLDLMMLICIIKLL